MKRNTNINILYVLLLFSNFTLQSNITLAGGNPWGSYRFAPDTLQEIDLASGTAWTLSIDDGAPRAIKVTAGGWNSDQQTPQIPSASVKDHVLYEREISIPAEAKDRVVKVLFGGCNYSAEVFLDDKKVAEHLAPMTPFEADLTGLAEAGKTYRLKVKAYSRYHTGRPPIVTAGFDFNKGMDSPYSGATRYAYGLTGHVRLAIYPPVHVSDLFVRSSVSKDILEVQVWIHNSTSQEKQIKLAGKLEPWTKGRWRYPSIPDVTVTIPANSTKQVTLGPVKWGLGPKSYWWPNIPFREDYVATLHNLKLEVREVRLLKDRVWHQRVQRFGFVEYKEGPFYYTVNGVRFTSFSDSNSYGQVGEYDCWTETPCFQRPALSAVDGPPHDQFKGCPETWKRYQRIGFNDMRLSTSVPTSYMLETADEAGYMLVPEGGSWGNGTCQFHKENFSAQLQGMIKVCRNHPSVARYSLANESFGKPDSPDNLWRWLIDAALEVDDSRPYVFEVNNGATGIAFGMKSGHAYQMEHYTEIVKSGDFIRGMGECAWATDGMGDFAAMAVKMRLFDWAHFAPWSWVNFWPNFLEGMSHERHPWTVNNHADRTDNVDGWNSPLVKRVQRSLNPYLLLDRKIEDLDRPLLAAGRDQTRDIEVFNGGLSGNAMALEWEARWDSPQGKNVAEGRQDFTLAPGFHTTRQVTFKTPAVDKERNLFLVMKSLVDGKVVFVEDRISYRVGTNAGK